MKALIHVTLKKDVLDPQGKAIRNACASLGYDAVEEVRQGKLFEVTLQSDDEVGARKLLQELCDKLIANPVIEDYEIVRIGS
ncbi:MAG TPA: phosphoribosylformylglycinamidine synthase subunit PurS [Myxococcota bacterium]